MFIGHLAPALAARQRWPRLALPVLLVATQGPDWLDVLLQTFMPWAQSSLWSHSVPSVALVAAVIAAIALAWSARRQLLLVAAGLYVTHPVLDFVTGLKPTWPGGPWVGLQLYQHRLADFALEAALITAGWWAYRNSLPAAQRQRPLVAMMAIGLVACQAAFDLYLTLVGSLR